jgi:hypothetical protein
LSRFANRCEENLTRIAARIGCGKDAGVGHYV